ncbi:beta-lactamase/transpeptidase-like protein [Pilatotrama ljubarskyi]|nr:beta-lactamase/transpeptidase-like protein [Pilatotrama ljubarskyi]
MARSNVPGLAVGVVRVNGPGSVETEFGSWGIMSEDGRNVTEDTLFSIGSCSKAFLALSMGILMDDFRRGRNATTLPSGVSEFTWDTRISDLLPGGEWALADEWATKEATVADALSHVTGLPRHDFAWNAEDSTLDIVKRLRHLKMTHGLRMKWNYNNQMYILGAHIISKFAGMHYSAFAKERILEPLGMDATTFFPYEAERSGNFSHAWSDTGRRIPFWLNPNGTDFDMMAGPGGVISSTRDMSKWISALLHGVNDLRPDPPLGPISDLTEARAVTYGRSPAPGWSVQTYGLGWMRTTYHDNELLWHTGAIPGHRAIVGLLPRESAGVVALVNSDDPLSLHVYVALNLLHSILGLPLLPEPPEQVLSDVPPGFVPFDAEIAKYIRKDTALEALQNDESSAAVNLVPLVAYAGTYANLGYGNFTLCSTSTDGDYCDDVRAAFRLTHNDTLKPALLAEWPRLLATHLRLEPLPTSGVHFWMTPHFIFPDGYGENTTAFDYELFPPGYEILVQCVRRDHDHPVYGPIEGCGVFLSWKSYVGKKPGLHVREQADVWFEKVD